MISICPSLISRPAVSARKAGAAILIAEQRLEQIAHRSICSISRVAQVQIAHRDEIAHRYRALPSRAAEETRPALEKAAQRLAIGRIEVGNLARAAGSRPSAAVTCLGALAQIDRQADAEPEQQLEMGVAQMFDRDCSIAARPDTPAQVEVVMGHLDRHPHRIEVAKIDRARDQHLVADQRHFAPQLALALRGEPGHQGGVE